jgi:hypothetical protein
MRHYYVYTLEPGAAEVFKFIQHHALDYELHLTRTRFWVPEGRLQTELMLRFSECVYLVDEGRDLATGMPLEPNRQL